jgi:hypothetical protein
VASNNGRKSSWTGPAISQCPKHELAFFSSRGRFGGRLPPCTAPSRPRSRHWMWWRRSTHSWSAARTFTRASAAVPGLGVGSKNMIALVSLASPTT